MIIFGTNQVAGRVSAINEGAVNAAVDIESSAGLNILAVITLESYRELDIEVGDCVTAVFSEIDAEISTAALHESCNGIPGQITNVDTGAVSSRVTVQVSDGMTLSAMVSNRYVQSLCFAVGGWVYVTISPYHVQIAISD